jgi:HEAT repeat protein
MKRLLYLTVALGLLLPGLQFSLWAAQTNEEQSLIGVLRSDHSPAEKDAACARLKRIGTDQSVPALAALLTDEQLSHSARYALESMPTPKAGQALVDALATTSEATKVGIIISLGYRHETRAVSALAKLLTDHGAHVAAAATTALGQIGGSKALKALQAATATSTGLIHDAVVDACLRCANRLLASGSQGKALAVFQQLYDTEKKDSVRTAAFRGMILASGNGAVPLMTDAIMGSDGASQIAALQLVREVPGANSTKKLAAMLSRVGPPVQTALIEGLAQRGDILAAPAIVVMVSSSVPEVRLAAINALGVLGDATVVPVLGIPAAFASGEEQKAARLALVVLRRGDPTETLVRLLPAAKPEVQAEFARALGERGDKSAVPKLVELAREQSGSASKAALQALVLLVDDSQLGLMVQFVAEAKTDTARADAAEALNSACHQIQTRRGKVNIQPVVEGLATGAAEARIALLPVCSGLIDPSIRTVLRAAVAAQDPKVRAAAIRALCDTSDAQLLPDVLKIACGAPEENFRTLAIRACVRLTTQEETIKLSVKEQIEPLQAILATTLSAEQKRVVLAGLAEIPGLQSLKLAEPMLDEAAIQLEAAKTVTKIASALPYAQAEAAASSLKKVVATTTDAEARRAAEAALNDIQSGADYITAWQIAGPYLQEGKDYKDLFDIAFPPEAANAPGVKWRALSPSPDSKRPWVMDLLKALGGEQRVAYARTWVHSDQPQPAQLELGTDDGVKVWLNRKVVHANNTFRGLQPGSDKVSVTLNAGWNPLLLKVTQLNQGWAFCARFRKPDGSHLDGLQFAAQRPERAAASTGK